MNHGVTSSLSLHLLLSHQKLLDSETKIMRLHGLCTHTRSHIVLVAAFSFIFSSSHSVQRGSAVTITNLEENVEE